MGGIDYGRHSEDYAACRPGFPPSFYRRLEALFPLEGSRALDLATGPGIIALELAKRGSSVVGIDVAKGQVEVASRLARERRLDDRASFSVARAESTGCRSGAFDLAIAGQCWHWFERDAAMREMQRVVRPGGWLVVAHYSYLAAHSSVARETEELILQFNPAWPMAGAPGMHPEYVDELIHAGFRLIEVFCYDHAQEFSHARWRGRMRTCNGVGSGGLPPAEVQRFDAALGKLLANGYPDPMLVEHRVWCVIVENRVR